MALTSSFTYDDVPGKMQMTYDKAHSWDEWNATKMGVSGGMIHWGPQTINKYFFESRVSHLSKKVFQNLIFSIF